MRRLWLVTALLFLAASVAAAQTKISGTQECAKAEPQCTLQVGDRPDHAIGITQSKCTWTKPLEIEGVQAKDDINTAFNDISGNKNRIRGYDVGTMADGDKFHVRYVGTGTLKEGAPESAEGTWSFLGGTGKLKGLKGKGTWRNCKPAGGGLTCDIEGEYTLPKKGE